MKRKKSELKREAEIPKSVEVKVETGVIAMKSGKGELYKNILEKWVKVEVSDNKISLSSKRASRNEKRVISSLISSIKNMLKGLSEGFKYKLKICSGHFPMSVNVEGSKLKIKNFLGEKIPREAALLKGVKVEVKGDEIFLEGSDIEKLGQTASNIEQSTRITNRDRRVFQDGIYIVEKANT